MARPRQARRRTGESFACATLRQERRAATSLSPWLFHHHDPRAGPSSLAARSFRRRSRGISTSGRGRSPSFLASSPRRSAATRHRAGATRRADARQQPRRLFETLERSSAFKRVAFLQTEAPQPEVEEQFAELLFRWTTLKSLDREIQDMALDLSDCPRPNSSNLFCCNSRLPMPACAPQRTTPAIATAPSASRDHCAAQGENFGAQRGRRVERRRSNGRPALERHPYCMRT